MLFVNSVDMVLLLWVAVWGDFVMCLMLLFNVSLLLVVVLFV